MLLKRVFERPLRFSEADLTRSISRPGTGSRLRIVMDKLLRGASWLASARPNTFGACARHNAWCMRRNRSAAVQACPSLRSSWAALLRSVLTCTTWVMMPTLCAPAHAV